MKHAGATSLAVLAPLLERLRALDGTTERKLGIYYVRSRAFLHFHEDPQGFFADVRLDESGFTRLPVNTRAEQDALISLATKVLARTAKPRGRKA